MLVIVVLVLQIHSTVGNQLILTCKPIIHKGGDGHTPVTVIATNLEI